MQCCPFAGAFENWLGANLCVVVPPAAHNSVRVAVAVEFVHSGSIRECQGLMLLSTY